MRKLILKSKVESRKPKVIRMDPFGKSHVYRQTGKKLALCSAQCLAGIFIFLLPVCSFAQADIHFSQFYETTILRNPALTGVFAGNYKLGVYYRSQWSSVTNPYETVLFNAEYRISLSRFTDDFLSLGILGYSDKAGEIDQRITAFYPAINYNKSLNPDNNSYLSFGFAAGYVQYSFDPSKATFNNQFQNGTFDPNNPSLETLPGPKRNIADLGAGINYNLSPGKTNEATYIIGVSCYHINQPVFSYYNSSDRTENIRINLNAAMARELNENVLLQVHANISQQGAYSEFIGGGLVGWRSTDVYSEPLFQIYAGLMYRYNDAFIPVIKIRYKSMSFGLSYDINTSSLKPASNMQGGYELTLSSSAFFPKNRDYKKTVCPRFN
jgi:type IX secretion system PorP/SprF family membrane protein